MPTQFPSLMILIKYTFDREDETGHRLKPESEWVWPTEFQGGPIADVEERAGCIALEELPLMALGEGKEYRAFEYEKSLGQIHDFLRNVFNNWYDEFFVDLLSYNPEPNGYTGGYRQPSCKPDPYGVS